MNRTEMQVRDLSRNKKDYFIRTRVVIYCLKGKIHSVLEAIEHEVWPL